MADSSSQPAAGPLSSQHPQPQPQPPSQPQPQPQSHPDPASSAQDPSSATPGLTPTSSATIIPKQEPDTADPGLDASIEQDIDLNNANMANVNPAADDAAAAANADPAPTSVDALAASSTPSKKETGLREFLGKMDEYAPIPNSTLSPTLPYPRRRNSPLPHPRRPTTPRQRPQPNPPHLARLLALATQKFIADVAADSYQYARIRASNSTSASNPMGSLNAASGLGVPAGAAGVGSAGAAAMAGGDAKGKAGTHLGIQRAGFGGGGSGGSGQGRTVLTMEDLGMAVGEYGVSVKRGEFYR
ncbi:hypothetical protein BO70DRAFT_395570 [Aspergillus heteromorphus CBS 117.55]|uniref:Transcription initiation factor TFIID subunit 10 n=1 Tax=Aspergillus heteromorphus CBS 117.55 TaxID=1448321 RepID=A0A317WGT8_9EURO|nr:uncharacterized protein BO70DRAFT_395570 [Aspergillus heteromorphus CBS 117.55]PWY84891.1 hypothetical protein BO70DRAFT_395570 [Aspergillus heteromorphus CBS 117.55]